MFIEIDDTDMYEDKLYENEVLEEYLEADGPLD